ncbi:hypothetical protein DESAMIL20_1118 [Desulfurella amilsii]|uniref:Uncharacterized protein n=1 Tax=Desulfurella amilsii TaxID=1562698 RepID=A0A1X4XVM1_9BACT|nr:hypothetical protein [Desulfurella amilsii]OSS41565.1 hypothetical protein DESAMIL20_1118 [Desulfurella amilsii]
MGFEDVFKKFVKIKFIRNLRYEPHIIEAIQYINPENFDNVLVFYKEINYLKSILLEHLTKDHIFECNIESLDKCLFEVKFDCIIVFLCKNSSNQNAIYETINKVAKKGANIFFVDYLMGNKLFNLALRLSDKTSYEDIKHATPSIFEEKNRLIDCLESKKNNITIKKFLV